MSTYVVWICCNECGSNINKFGLHYLPLNLGDTQTNNLDELCYYKAISEILHKSGCKTSEILNTPVMSMHILDKIQLLHQKEGS